MMNRMLTRGTAHCPLSVLAPSMPGQLASAPALDVVLRRYRGSSPGDDPSAPLPAQAFTSLSLFSVLRMPLFQLPQLISQVINARVALTRIQAFLAADQQPDLPVLPPAQPGALPSSNFKENPQAPR